ncbi:phospholipase A2 inhibitor and Ly6/PLAUR domain-containing protein-like [Lithobates pipiens]
MASPFQILGVLSALVASGYSLSCTECSSLSNSCTGPSVTCPSGSVCGAVYVENLLIGLLISTTYTMSCISQNKCDIKGSMSFSNIGRLKMGISCCRTDRCTPTLPSLPGSLSGSNGETCPVCASSDSTECKTSDTLQCYGDENTCLLLATKISGPTKQSTAIRGCATKSSCNIGSLSTRAQGVSTDIQFICPNGSAGLQKSFYLPAMICIFFLKLWI